MYCRENLQQCFFLFFDREEESAGFRKEFHIFFVPRKSLLCERKLKVWFLAN